MITFTVEGEELARAARRLSHLAVDTNDQRQGYAFIAGSQRLSIVGRGRGATFAFVGIGYVGDPSTGVFPFPGTSLRELTSLRGLVTFNVESPHDIHYRTASGAGFHWQPTEVREIPSLDPELGRAEVLGRVPGGLLGRALSRAVVFVRAINGARSKSVLELAVASHTLGFDVHARAADAEFHFRAGQGGARSLSVREEDASGLAAFFRGEESAVALRAKDRLVYGVDVGGNCFGFARAAAPSCDDLKRGGHPAVVHVDGKAVHRALAHLARAGKTVAAIRLDGAAGDFQVGCRDPSGGRLVGYQASVETEGVVAPQRMGIDLPIREVEALVAGVESDEVAIDIHHDGVRARAEAVVVREQCNLNSKGRRPARGDPPEALFGCTIERVLCIPATRRLLSAVIETPTLA